MAEPIEAGASLAELLPVIQKAKQEWECTADALSAMVCLLRADGVILRANRAVEHWGLGSVSAAVGKSAHAVLHPACTASTCELALGLAAALPQLQEGHVAEFEYRDAARNQTLQFVLRPMRNDGEPADIARDTRSVLLVSDVSALRQAQHALIEANDSLESRVGQRTRELADSNRELRSEIARREQAERELLASRNNLATLSEQLIQAQEQERRRIALELHDSVGQSLSAVKYTLERAIIMLQRPDLGDPESTLASAVQRIHETADGIRSISMNLRPPVLDNLGAASATIWFCRGFAETYPDITVRAEVTAQNADIPPRIATHLFRSVQELLNNVAKHAAARTVWVTLQRKSSRLLLEVRDDGRGMAHQAADRLKLPGSGIRNLRERAEMTGAKYSMDSSPGRGTATQIAWSLGTEDARADVTQ
jgi:signal transduction histidine kinase